jgi:hypothetical protein
MAVLPGNSARVRLAMRDGIGASSIAMFTLLHLLFARVFDRIPSPAQHRDLVPLSAFQSRSDCTTAMLGHDFREI